MDDLVLLVPDKNTEYILLAGLSRHKALGVRPVTFKVIVESGRDGGVRRRGVQLLRLERQSSSHAVMILDHEGCGSSVPAVGLEAQLDAELARDWGSNAKAIVAEPEIDMWLWGAETHLREVAGWPRPEDVRQWLRANGFRFNDRGKPNRPKEALDAMFRCSGVSRSSANYWKLARRLSIKRCEDPSFGRLREILLRWFAPGSP